MSSSLAMGWSSSLFIRHVRYGVLMPQGDLIEDGGYSSTWSGLLAISRLVLRMLCR